MNPSIRNSSVHHARWLYSASFTNYARVLIANYKHSWSNLKEAISQFDIAEYEGRPLRRMLVPKQGGDYRVAIQLDPVDTIVYTALAYEAATCVEAFRVPLESKVACSYRVKIGPTGELFRRNNGWDDFHSKSQELAEGKNYNLVLTADIADFFNQVGHHRVRNALEHAGVDHDRAKNIENVLMNFTRGQSQRDSCRSERFRYLFGSMPKRC